jgi:mRNA-degrading endonuclease RelE of RelBE toxin-antitoxin system
LANSGQAVRRKSQVPKAEPGAPAEDGQYRLRSGRFRFLYDVPVRKVVLLYCGMRRKDIY